MEIQGYGRSRDRNLVSSEPYELQYVLDVLVRDYPCIDRQDLKRILDESKTAIEPSESREKLMAEVRRRLGNDDDSGSERAAS